MANHKSAEKRVRQTKVRTLRNKIKNTQARSVIKSLQEAISTNNKDAALKLLPEAQKRLALLAKSGIVKKNNAARRTSRLAKAISNLK